MSLHFLILTDSLDTHLIHNTTPTQQHSSPVSTDPQHRNVPTRFRRYLRAQHAESESSSRPRGDIEKPRSDVVKPQMPGPSAKNQVDTRSAVKPPSGTEKCVKVGETGQTTGESSGDQPQPKNKGRSSRARKGAAQKKNGVPVEANVEPKRRSKRLEAMKTAAHETTSDSHAGAGSTSGERAGTCLWW